MIKSLLVALDGSVSSDVAQSLALEIGQRRDAHVTAIGVVDSPWIHRPEAVPSGASHYKERRDAALQLGAATLTAQVLEEFKRAAGAAAVAHATVSAEGRPYEVIEAESDRHDLIVIGRDTDFHANEETELSETAERLIRDNPKPVLMAPRQAVNTSHVLVAADGELTTARAVHMFALLGLAQGRDVTVVSVGEDDAQLRSWIEPAIALLSLHGGAAKAHPAKTGAHPGDVILSEARKLDAGMIVMGAFGDTGLRELLVGSTTRRLLRSANQALFIHH